MYNNIQLNSIRFYFNSFVVNKRKRGSWSSFAQLYVLQTQVNSCFWSGHFTHWNRLSSFPFSVSIFNYGQKILAQQWHLVSKMHAMEWMKTEGLQYGIFHSFIMNIPRSVWKLKDRRDEIERVPKFAHTHTHRREKRLLEARLTTFTC